MLILKSASPRRQQILKDLRLQFRVEPSQVDEDVRVGEPPLSYLKRVTIAKLELEKAKSEEIYISSDTIVVLDEQILGKPTDFAEGKEILSCLSGKIHSVYSGLGILTKGEVLFDYDETRVEFKPWGKEEIAVYLNECKPYDKAGSYGIQDEKSPVLRFTGSYSNVLGFPLRKFYQHFSIWKEFLSQ